MSVWGPCPYCDERELQVERLSPACFVLCCLRCGARRVGVSPQQALKRIRQDAASRAAVLRRSSAGNGVLGVGVGSPAFSKGEKSTPLSEEALLPVVLWVPEEES